MLLTAGLFPGIITIVAFFLNFIALGYGSLAAIPTGTVFAVLAIWLFVSLPLTLIGTIVGRNFNGVADNPCRVNPVPRQIPEKKWYVLIFPPKNFFLAKKSKIIIFPPKSLSRRKKTLNFIFSPKTTQKNYYFPPKFFDKLSIPVKFTESCR